MDLKTCSGCASSQPEDKEHELAIHTIKNTVFSIPYYQRGYRWTANEVLALLEDLLAFARNGSSGDSYCLQPLVLQVENGKCWVVDGQQRLTTMAIILRGVGVETNWDIEYSAEGGKRLSDLLKCPGKLINDHFREKAKEIVEKWLKPDRKDNLCSLLRGESQKRVVFLRHELHEDSTETENNIGHDAFQRLNAGKTPLTSSELIRALYMESKNDLDEGEKMDIAKEWDLIESAMADESFWSIWANKQFRDVPTRMDFLFSIVAKVKPEDARDEPLFVYRTFENLVVNENTRVASPDKLKEQWKQTLRCWWWMQSCYSDTETFHLLGWLATFSERNTYALYHNIWETKAKCRMARFTEHLRGLVYAKCLEDVDLKKLHYKNGVQEQLKAVFVLLNCLESEKRHIRFRFDLYKQCSSWDIEHISSQTAKTDKNMKAEDKKKWIELVYAELTDKEKDQFDQVNGFENKWNWVWQQFENSNDKIKAKDKDSIGNLALLDSHTNRSYKNAILPVKRTKILYEAPSDGRYILPCTQSAFSKAYSSHAAQMRYWSESDAEGYLNALNNLAKEFENKGRIQPDPKEAEA